MSRMVARRCAAWAERTIMSRPADFVIGGSDNPYLLRWYVFPRNKLGNAYLHEYHRPDDDRALHDHPWPSFSLCLSGTIIEVTAKKPQASITVGDMALRGIRKAHRIDLPVGEKGQRTLFITGPRLREWGFHCPKGWVHWRKFTDTRDGASEVGVGCE